MSPRTRILDAAMLVFRRQGFRRSSIEQAAEAAGLTRQALYHHFESKEALFRAVIERLHEEALAAEIAAATAAENTGGSLADILVASVSAKLGQLAASLDGSPHVEELFSEHLLQSRDLYQKYTALYADQLATTITRICRKQGLVLNAGMTPRELARCVEMAVNGTKSAYPALQPPGAFLKDLEIMLRTLIAGAVGPSNPRAHAEACEEGSRPIHLPQIWRSQMSTMTINGKLAPLPDDPDALLVDVVRDALDLTGTKLVCGAGVCGACTVLVDGEPAVSCLMPAGSAAEQVGHDRRGHRRQGIASGAEGVHGARRAAMRLLHAGLHRRGRGVLRFLARGKGNRRALARGNRRGAVGPSVPLRRL